MNTAEATETDLPFDLNLTWKPDGSAVGRLSDGSDFTVEFIPIDLNSSGVLHRVPYFKVARPGKPKSAQWNATLISSEQASDAGTTGCLFVMNPIFENGVAQLALDSEFAEEFVALAGVYRAKFAS